MIRNYTTQTDLEAYIPKLDSLLWGDETNFDKQKSACDVEVMNDFINKDYKAIFLRNDLTLRSSGVSLIATTAETVSAEDSITRMRFVIDCKVITSGDKTVTLYGSNDKITYNSITDILITATGIKSEIISQFYKYYKVTATVSSGSFDYAAFMTETSYDLLHKYKWLEIILIPLAKSDTTYETMLKEFQKKYIVAWNELKVFYDSTETFQSANLSESDNKTMYITK